MPVKAFEQAHPDGPGLVYHNSQHSRYVQRIAYTFAKARGLSEADAKFLSEVALLHDWDPDRQPGTPARVKVTIKVLKRDFYGAKPLHPRFRGTSVLKERFGWDRRKLKMAVAIIQRTEFPFSVENKGYKHRSPVARYAKMVSLLAPDDRAFVLREAAILSEYADKLSTYLIKDYDRAFDSVEGLANEITAASGKLQDVVELRTYRFLADIGNRKAFSQDVQLARRFGIKGFTLPTPKQFFASMPPSYLHNYRTVKDKFRNWERAIRGAARLKRPFVKVLRRALFNRRAKPGRVTAHPFQRYRGPR